MARLIKLPAELRDWKVDSLVKSEGELGIYKVVKENDNGEATNAVLRVISMNKDSYSEDRAAFFEEEADFVASLEELGDVSVYLDVYVQNNPSKQSCSLYIFTEDLKSLETVMKQKEFSEEEIVDFGIKLSTVLERLETENIFLGNISPQNIYVTSDSGYKLGGFSDLESKIEGPSFMSPEVYKHEQADFTTDIYSLGIIMYAMSNNGKLPFEGDGVSQKEANDKRLAGAAVPAPANGGEKLKSVIVIACQADNSVRWKNAGNIKNALTSIKNELEQGKADSPAPSPTDSANSDNGKSGGKAAIAGAVAVAGVAVGAAAANVIKNGDSGNADNGAKAADSAQAIEKSGSNVSDSPIESTDVFDEYSVGEKRNNFAAKKNSATQKDYGDYFDDDNETDKQPKKDASSAAAASSLGSSDTSFGKNAFATLEPEESAGGKHAQKKNGKGKVIAVVALCAVILAAAGVVGCVVYNNISGGSDSSGSGSTADTAASTTVSETVSATQATESTTQETTLSQSSSSESSESSGSSSSSSSGSGSSSNSSSSSSGSSNGSSGSNSSSGKTVTSVLGYTYENAKQTLEAQGFTVAVWGYQYSQYYTEGYVMSQTPEGGNSASGGSTVYLMISRGLASQQSSDSSSSSSQSSSSSSSGTSNSSGDYLFANSASSYLSSSEVASLSDSELQLAINEIYARRGRIFNDSSVNAYFNSKSWYEGKYTADEFSSKVTFNEYEQKNLQLLINERNSRS